MTQELRTKVLLSSIFFMADSVVSGNFTIWKASSFCVDGALRVAQQHSQQLKMQTYVISHMHRDGF